MPTLDNKRSLFIIDDDDINIFIITKIAERTGYEVTVSSCHNGKQAIEIIQDLVANNKALPDLALIDINMPIMNGWEFVEAFEEMNIEGKDMYMLSSSVYENDIEKAKTYKSVKGFISKPLSMERLKELFAAINKS